jgi:hypothetical protein
MEKKRYNCMAITSGQRCGEDRRKKDVALNGRDDRRKGEDRRCKWPVLNEWSCVLERKAEDS